jgi:hypothetical protein
MKNKTKVTGYVSKRGILGTYKIIGEFTTEENIKRVKLESFGKTLVKFWVNKDQLCDPPEPVRKPGEQTQICWECGSDFTWRECQRDGGDWEESYCGC